MVGFYREAKWNAAKLVQQLQTLVKTCVVSKSCFDFCYMQRHILNMYKNTEGYNSNAQLLMCVRW